MTLYCPWCGAPNPDTNQLCGQCGTRLDNPNDPHRHQFAYPPHYPLPTKLLTCPSPQCGVQVQYPSPLKDGTYNLLSVQPGQLAAQPAVQAVRQRNGVYGFALTLITPNLTGGVELRGLNCSQPELISWVEFSRPTYCGIPN